MMRGLLLVEGKAFRETHTPKGAREVVASGVFL